MRHRRLSRRFGRQPAHRKAMFRNMVTSLIVHESIRTTDTKAKELRGVAERMITLGKKGDLASRRRAAAFVRDKDAVKKLFDELAERFKGREGGYTRIIKIGRRQGDNAPISQIEFLSADEKPKKTGKKTKKAKTPESAPKVEAKEAEATEEKPAEEESSTEPEAAAEENAEEGAEPIAEEKAEEKAAAEGEEEKKE